MISLRIQEDILVLKYEILLDTSLQVLCDTRSRKHLYGTEYVPVTAEWKHGNGKITIVPVCGVIGKEEVGIKDISEAMARVAMREFEEETGFTLKNVEPLSPATGLWAIVRNVHVSCFPFLGEVDMSIKMKLSKLDDTEHLQMILFPIREWMKFIEDPSVFEANDQFCLETCARDVTYAALRRFGRLNFV